MKQTRRIVFFLALFTLLFTMPVFAADRADKTSVSTEDAKKASWSDRTSEDDFIAEQAAGKGASILTGATPSESGKYKDEFTGDALILYNSLVLVDSEMNAITLHHRLLSGETEESVWRKFTGYYDKVLFAYKYDNPEAMMWTSCFVGAFMDSDGEYVDLIAYYEPAEWYSSSLGYEAKSLIDEVIAGAPQSGRLNKVIYAARWICDNVSYDMESLSMEVDSEWFWYAHEPMGALIKHEGVCESYAKVFKILMSRLSIPCVIVCGSNHMWNYVRMTDGIWYMVDCTFADQADGMDTGYILVSNLDPDESHKPDDNYNYPKTSEGSFEGHIFDEVYSETLNDCENNGSVTYRCSDCGKKVSLPLLKGHRYGDSYLKAEASCEVGNVYSKDCVNCDACLERTTDPLGHDYNDDFTCERCGALKMVENPTLISALNTKDGIAFTWKDAGVPQYKVVRKTGSGYYKTIGYTSSTSFVDESAESGVTYRYSVLAYNMAGDKLSSYRTGLSVTRLLRPEITDFYNDFSGLTVTYNEVKGADKYIIYYKSASSESFKKAGETSDTSYTIKGLTSGKKIYVRLKAKDSDNDALSINSYYTVQVYLYAPKVTSASNYKAGGVKITWEKSSGADGYYIYRRTSTGSYKKVKTITGGSTLSWTNTGLTRGKTYYYAVRAYKGDVVSARQDGRSVKITK